MGHALRIVDLEPRAAIDNDVRSLTLLRRTGQRILVGEDVTAQIVSLRPAYVSGDYRPSAFVRFCMPVYHNQVVTLHDPSEPGERLDIGVVATDVEKQTVRISLCAVGDWAREVPDESSAEVLALNGLARAFTRTVRQDLKLGSHGRVVPINVKPDRSRLIVEVRMYQGELFDINGQQTSFDVYGIKGNSCKLRTCAPLSLKILRKELEGTPPRQRGLNGTTF